eukprot:7438007-Alexandrium_andersonii.AAC.1
MLAPDIARLLADAEATIHRTIIYINAVQAVLRVAGGRGGGFAVCALRAFWRHLLACLRPRAGGIRTFFLSPSLPIRPPSLPFIS